MSVPFRPLYLRLLRLRHIGLSPVVSFVLFEGTIVLAALLAFAELVDWWAVLVLPVVVGAMVKLNDLVAGALMRAQQRRLPVAKPPEHRPSRSRRA